MVDVDQSMWNYHPRTASDHRGQWYVTPKSQGQRGGTWIRTLPTPDHEGFQQNMIEYMYDTRPRGGFSVGDGDERGYGHGYLSLEAADSAIPNRPRVTYTGDSGFPTDGLRFISTPFSDPGGASTFGAMEWRAGEISNPDTPGYVAGEPWVYEIEERWESGLITSFSEEITLPTGALRSGHTYRVRVRHQDNTGRWSHWSEPVEFTTTLPDLSPYLDGLVISELMYHPADPSPAELAAGFNDDDDFEFIELHNAGPVPLDLSDLRFTKGADFNFLDADITTLAPGGFVLVVSNRAAFEMRYGTGLPVAGEWDPADRLDNGGERIKLSFGAGDAIRDFTYDDESPWPITPDGSGVSLLLAHPSSVPDHALVESWQAGSIPHGTPGSHELTGPFATWMAAQGATDPDAPFGSSSLSNMLAYALGADLVPIPETALPATTIAHDGEITFPALHFRVRREAFDVIYLVEISEDLVLWQSGAAFTMPSGTPRDNGDGTLSLEVRSRQPLAANPHQYLRLRVVPAGSQTTSFPEWMTARGATDPDAPFGSASMSHLLAYAVGADLASAPSASLPAATIVSDGSVDYPALRFRVRQEADDLSYTVELSGDLVLWESGGVSTTEHGSPENNGDGTVTHTIRSLQSLATNSRQYLRLRVHLAP
jgi:hypothetical protein